MLQFKDAIKQSFQYLAEIYEGEELPNKLLEEIEYDERDDVWKVVIGFDSNRVTTTTAGNALLGSGSTTKEKLRNYKLIRLKGADGSFAGMFDRML